MSNYLGKAKNPNTGNLEDCVFLDDFYGKRKYAVRFKDGTTYRESEVEGLPTAIKQAIAEERARVVHLIKNSKDPYMLPATEERFLKDLASLEPLTDKE